MGLSINVEIVFVCNILFIKHIYFPLHEACHFASTASLHGSNQQQNNMNKLKTLKNYSNKQYAKIHSCNPQSAVIPAKCQTIQGTLSRSLEFSELGS